MSGDLTPKGKKIALATLGVIMVLIAILFIIQSLVNYVFHGINGSPSPNQQILGNLTYATYILPSVFIALGIVLLATILNVSYLTRVY